MIEGRGMVSKFDETSKECLVEAYYAGASLVLQSRSAPKLEAPSLRYRGRVLIKQGENIEARLREQNASSRLELPASV